MGFQKMGYKDVDWIQLVQGERCENDDERFSFMKTVNILD
jgi:hypothetical protein